ncbi:Rieske (2Fe-2S) protein [Ekhidna sp. To15]|uniref:Rieske (2Fe-2S) protein n=1 Tax=Ekhidna sp. To15 TaxID=3395267 RepID=UPI003F523411
MKFKLFDSQANAKEVLRHNQPRLLRAGGKEICIVRTGEKLKAFRNECPHMGEALHRGNVNYLGEIVCPLHTFRFSMQTGEETSQRCKAMEVYTILNLPEGIFIEC